MVRMTVPRARSGVIAEAVRALDDAGIGIDDLAVRRPTLDDVFLALTGHAAEQDEEEDETRAGGGARVSALPTPSRTRSCWPGATCCASRARPTC